MANAMASQLHPVQSTHQGMGATVYDGGVCFRVWAPNAKSVAVAGTFNDFSSDALMLFQEGNGYWGADVDKIGVGDQYKFVIRTQDDELLWRNDPYARSLKTVDGHQNSVIAQTSHDWSTENDYAVPPWNELVIYELHVGTFNRGKNDDKGGTFASVIKRLDYLEELGINAIEVMAAGEFPFDKSWGYNPNFIFAIEEAYGGPNGFRDLVDECHKRNMAVIFDVVYNHLGPGDLEMWRFDGWYEGDGGGIYFYNDWRRHTPWGDTRPDYGRTEVRQYLRDNAIRWLETRHIDGLRWDGTAFIRNVYGHEEPAYDLPDGWSLMQWIHEEMNLKQPWKISIAEDLKQNEWITKPVHAGGAGFDSQWDSSFTANIRSNVIASADADRNMHVVANEIGRKFNGAAFERVIFTESHDAVSVTAKETLYRLPEAIWHGNADSYFSQKRSTLAAGLVFTSPGIPMLFQGQEFLEYKSFTDDASLTWSYAEKFSGIKDLYRDLIRLRRNWNNNTRGLKGQGVQVHHINDNEKLIAFHRWENGGAGDDVIVVANFSSETFDSYNIGFPQAGEWKVRFNSDWNGYSEVFGNYYSYDTTAGADEKDGMPFSGNIGIGPYTLLILSQ